MLAHVFTWSKTMKNIQKLLKKYFFIVRTRDSRKAHTRTWRKMQFFALRSDSQTLVDTQKLVALQQFHGFSLFSSMWTHAQACVCWSKYTTSNTRHSITGSFWTPDFTSPVFRCAIFWWWPDCQTTGLIFRSRARSLASEYQTSPHDVVSWRYHLRLHAGKYFFSGARWCSEITAVDYNLYLW